MISSLWLASISGEILSSVIEIYAIPRVVMMIATPRVNWIATADINAREQIFDHWAVVLSSCLIPIHAMYNLFFLIFFFRMDIYWPISWGHSFGLEFRHLHISPFPLFDKQSPLPPWKVYGNPEPARYTILIAPHTLGFFLHCPARLCPSTLPYLATRRFSASLPPTRLWPPSLPSTLFPPLFSNHTPPHLQRDGGLFDRAARRWGQPKKETSGPGL
jgi:hypothetical protein